MQAVRRKTQVFPLLPLIAQVLCTSVAAAGLVRAECARPVLVRMLSSTYKRGQRGCLFLKTGLALCALSASLSLSHQQVVRACSMCQCACPCKLRPAECVLSV